jgi:hypothetical protein
MRDLSFVFLVLWSFETLKFCLMVSYREESPNIGNTMAKNV